jgi:cytochrome c-type biogenesis protein CcmH/NrfG
VAACVVFFTNARFRLVMIPPMLVLAGLAIRPWRGRERIQLAVALAIGAAVAWPSYFGLGQLRVAQIDFNTAALEHRAGHLDRAAAYLRSGLAREPDDRGAWMELARVLEASGDHAAALDAASHATAPPVP